MKQGQVEKLGSLPKRRQKLQDVAEEQDQTCDKQGKQ